MEEEYKVSGMKFGGEANGQEWSYYKVMESAGEGNQQSYHLVMRLGKAVSFCQGSLIKKQRVPV